MASTRRLTFATVKSDGSGTIGEPGQPAWAIEEQATQIHRVWALQVQDSAAAEVEPARRKAVSVYDAIVAEKAHKLNARCRAHASY